MLTKRIEKMLYGNYTRMLLIALNKSWMQHSIKQQLYSHLHPISKIIEMQRLTSALCRHKMQPKRPSWNNGGLEWMMSDERERTLCCTLDFDDDGIIHRYVIVHTHIYMYTHVHIL